MVTMKFETKINKLGINEEEVKSIIENCECGEINGAYLIDLTKEKKEFIMEVIGNYFNHEERRDGEEETEWTDIKRISTFCKTFGITEDEIADYYRMGFNEGGCDIAYTLESNKDVILVLTDDERYNNSFIQYSPSQQTETAEEECSKEVTISIENEDNDNEDEKMEEKLKEVTALYDAELEKLTQLDSKTDLDEICTDKYLMAEYNFKKAQIEANISELEEKIEEINDKMAESEKWINFKLVSKNDERLYLEGEWDITSYDEDTDDGEWTYEQNDGTMQSHIPTYWKRDGENLSFEYDKFLDSIDWEMFRQWLWDCQNENKTVDCGDYLLHINEGACVEIDIQKDSDFDETYWATLLFKFNGKTIEFDEEIIKDLAEEICFDDNYNVTSISSIYLELPKTFSDYYDTDEYYQKERVELFSEMHEIACKYYARQLTRDNGIYGKHGEIMEQSIEDAIEKDSKLMYEFKCATDYDAVEKFLDKYGYNEE